jgi:hypothetical protein
LDILKLHNTFYLSRGRERKKRERDLLNLTNVGSQEQAKGKFSMGFSFVISSIQQEKEVLIS